MPLGSDDVTKIYLIPPTARKCKLQQSLHKIPNYNSIHQTRGNGKTGGGVAMFIHNTLIHNIKPDLSVNNDNIKAL